MKQIKLTLTRSSNGFVRKNGRLFSNPESFANLLPKKKGAEVETHKSGDMQATIKGKVVGYFWEAEGVGYFFETPKEFASFLKQAESGAFGEEDKRKKEKAPKGKKNKASESDSGKKGRRRRQASDMVEAEPEIDLDSIVNEDASPATNALEVFKVLKKEIKRVKVKSDNVNDLISVVEDLLKEAKKEKPEKPAKGKAAKVKPKKVASSSDEYDSDSDVDSSDAEPVTKGKKNKSKKSSSSSSSSSASSSADSDD